MDLGEAGPEGQPVLQEEEEMVGALCLCLLLSHSSWLSGSYAVPCGFFKGVGLAGAGLGEKRGPCCGNGCRNLWRAGPKHHGSIY